ncbi:MAG: 4-alpha-glucanotransferase [Rhodothermales bacterium]|nr:4-alpha-glucanotransferase [Rhodothermales bacterium]MBO6780965.1 4-alpha-glucanotransferase [Rhodothermales bacterium]
MTDTRQSGLLLHITSLPGPYGIGDLGAEAYRFADFLAEAGQTIWQVLPVVPTGYGESPYASPSTFAGNPNLISPDLLREDGLLSEADLSDVPDFPEGHVDFAAAIAFKKTLLTNAYEAFVAGGSRIPRGDYEVYCRRHQNWLDAYALFDTIKDAHEQVEWTAWPRELAMREDAAIGAFIEANRAQIDMRRFWQFLFDRQWSNLKRYCNERKIRIFGDLPIYVAQDSADVWSSPELFHLDENGNATVVAGVPPDYFSETGQRWGNPIYRWDRMEHSGFDWWKRRMARILEQVDLVRLDHFRGFEAFWEVPASEPTAINGRWVRGPGAELFHALTEHLGPLPVVAENLGVITDGVTNLMKRFGYPGMAILEFAFDAGPDNSFLPHNYSTDLVAYTGTHDNDTFVGWWTNTQSTQDAEVTQRALTYAREYLEVSDDTEVHWRAIRALMASVAAMVVTPMQDVLGVGSEGRLNTPGVAAGNWGWRMPGDAVTADLTRRIKTLTSVYGRN